MRSLSTIVIVFVLSGCSGNSNDPTNSSVAPSNLEAAANRGEGQSGGAFVLPDFNAQDPLSPDQWEVAIGSAIPVPADSVVADRNESVLLFDTTVNSGRTDFDYRRAISGDFVVTVEVSVNSRSSRPAHDRVVATNAWFQVRAADERTPNLAAPVYQGPNTTAQLQVLRRGDQVLCLCDGQPRGQGSLSGPVRFGLWMNGDGQLGIHSFKLEQVTPDLAMFSSGGSSSGGAMPAGFGGGPPPGFAGTPPGFGGPPPGMHGGFGGAPAGGGFGGGSPAAGFADNTNNAAAPDQSARGPQGSIFQFRGWEIPAAMIPDEYHGQVRSSFVCSFNSQLGAIRFDRTQGGPPFPLQYSKPMVGDFTADLEIVVVGEYAQRRGEVLAAVVPVDATGRLRTNALTPKDGAGQREYLLRFARRGNKVVTQIDHTTVMEQDLAVPARLQLLVAGEVDFSIKSLVFNRDSRGTGIAASESAARSPATARPTPTAPASSAAVAATPVTDPAEMPREPGAPSTSSTDDVAAALPSKFLDPAIFGFKIPASEVTLPKDQSVTTLDDDGEGVVARLYADVGENRIVMLPNGKLVARTRDDSPLTERRFRPATRKDITNQLKARFPGFKTQATRHFNYVYNTSPNFYTGTNRILETLLPGLRKFAEAQGIKTHDPDVPLVVIMFHTQQQFALYSKLPNGILAYYDPITNEIVMHEESPFLQRDPELAFKDTIATIAHEGAHQVLFNIGVQKRLSMWPQWLSEGIAEYLSPTSFGKDLRWKGPGATHDLRMLDLELYFKSRGLETTDETMIKYTAAAYRLSSSGYASAWAITHYLAANEKQAFAAHLREVSQREPFESPGEVLEAVLVPQNLQLFQKHFGDDLAGLEKKLIEHLKTLPYDDPYAELPHFVAMIEWKVDGKPKREANVFHLPSMARKWLEDKREVLSTEGVRTATVDVRDYANRPIAEREVRRFLSR